MHLALIKSQHRVCSVILGWLKHEEYTRYWFCDFPNLGTGACSVVIGTNVHRMDFCWVHTIAGQRYWSKTFELNACMRLELTDTNVKRTFLVCVSIYTFSIIVWLRIYGPVTPLLSQLTCRHCSWTCLALLSEFTNTLFRRYGFRFGVICSTIR